ncbi:MAG: 5'-nucleotidase [Chloroflexota bacterium]
MPVDLKDKLVIGISSRALFDLADANAVYERDGLTAYRRYQREHEQEILAPGTAFPLVKGLLAVNDRADAALVEVIIFSRNDADSAMRVFRSIDDHGLAITRGIFRGGRDPFPFLPALSCDVFLSAEPSQVLKARGQGVPAALIMSPPSPVAAEDDTEVRIAFDGDAVLFDAESQRVYDEEGLDAFHDHEALRADEAMSPGPFRPFLDGLARVQAHFSGVSPIRTALVTARAAPAHFRVINTLRSWGVEIDETFFLGGVDKADVLEAFGAHIFFDDQRVHAESAARLVPAAQVLWPNEELGSATADRLGVVVPAPGRGKRGAKRPVPDRSPKDEQRATQQELLPKT